MVKKLIEKIFKKQKPIMADKNYLEFLAPDDGRYDSYYSCLISTFINVNELRHNKGYLIFEIPKAKMVEYLEKKDDIFELFASRRVDLFDLNRSQYSPNYYTFKNQKCDSLRFFIMDAWVNTNDKSYDYKRYIICSDEISYYISPKSNRVEELQYGRRK